MRNPILVVGLGILGLAGFSLFKVFQINERFRLEFRSEFFNAFNHANQGLPDLVVFAGNGNYRPSSGIITQTLSSSRQIQFGLKVLF